MFSFLKSRRHAAVGPASPPCVPPGVRVYAIGDIHGCHDLFLDLLSRIEADNAARAPAQVVLVLLGDLVDRGPDSRQAVETAMVRPGFVHDYVVLRGNHEDIFVQAVADPARIWDVWLQVGGRATLESYGIPMQLIFKGPTALERSLSEEVPASHLQFLAGLPTSYRVGDYFFTHAGVRPGVPLERQSERDLLWIRGTFLQSEAYHGAVIVHGHTPAPEIEDMSNRIGLDTGAYESGILSAVGLEHDQRWFLQSTK